MTSLRRPFAFADLIDAPNWSLSSSSEIVGDGSSNGYAYAVYARTTVGAADNGLTVTPNSGDTTKKLFFPNAGYRNNTNGVVQYYGERGYYWPADQNPNETSRAWLLYFYSVYTSGRIGSSTKIYARPIRCVRS